MTDTAAANDERTGMRHEQEIVLRERVLALALATARERGLPLFPVGQNPMLQRQAWVACTTRRGGTAPGSGAPLEVVLVSDDGEWACIARLRPCMRVWPPVGPASIALPLHPLHWRAVPVAEAGGWVPLADAPRLLDIRFEAGLAGQAESYAARKVQARVNETLRLYETGLADGLDLWLPVYARCGPVAA